MSSCPHRVEALGVFQSNFLSEWVCPENCTPVGTRGEKVGGWFGIGLICRIKDDALATSAEAWFVQLRDPVRKFVEDDHRDRQRKRTDNSQLTENQDKSVRHFLGVHHSPVQYARISHLTENKIFRPLMEAFTKDLSVFFWIVSNFFAAQPVDSDSLSIIKLSRLEFVCWKIRFAIRKIDKFVYPLSLIDLLEEWAYKNELRLSAFDSFKTYLKLYTDADKIFHKMPPPSDSWKTALQEEINLILKVIENQPTRRIIHLPRQTKPIPRESVSGSLSDVSSPEGEDTLVVNPVKLVRAETTKRSIILRAEDDFKVHVIASTLLEMKRMGWMLPFAGWVELVVLLCQIQIYKRDYKPQSEFCLTNLVHLTENLNDLNTSEKYRKHTSIQKWELILETVQGVCSKEVETEALFAAWAEAALLYTFCFNALKLSWNFAHAERDSQAKEEEDRCKIFEWMGQCTTTEKTDIFRLFLEKSKPEQIDRSYDPHTALEECKVLQVRYSLSPFKSLKLWLHFIHCPLKAAPREGKWLNLSETRVLITRIEEYCYGAMAKEFPNVKMEEHCYGTALTGEMVVTLFMDHPLHSSQADTFIRLVNIRREILNAATPFVNNFFNQELNSGPFPALVRLLTEGIEKTSSSYLTRMKIAERIKRATLLERGLRRALLKCPFLTEDKKEVSPINPPNGIHAAAAKQQQPSGPPIFEGWVEYVKSYGQKGDKEGEEEEFTIGTWLLPLPHKPGSVRLEYSRFYSFSSLRGKTGEREFDFSKELFTPISIPNNPVKTGDRTKKLFREFIHNFSQQAVTYKRAPSWPFPTTYNKDDLEGVLNECLASATIPRTDLDQYLYNGGLEPNNWEIPCKLFRFLIRLKQDLEKLYDTEEKKQLPNPTIEKIAQARKGQFLPLLGKKGVTLMNRTPVGDLFDIQVEEYRREIDELIENLSGRKGEEVLVKKDVIVALQPQAPRGELEMFLSAQFVENEGWSLKARTQIYIHNPIFFQEVLHLPLSFPMSDMENAIILLMARTLRRYYVMNTGLVPAEPPRVPTTW